MKAIYIFFALLLLPAALLGQATGQETDSSANNSDVTAEVKALRETLLQMQKQMAAQQQEIENLKAQSNSRATASAANRLLPKEDEISAHDLASTAPEPASGFTPANVRQQPTQQDQQKGNSEEPIGVFRLGDAVLTPGGFVDFENIFRTTNTRDDIATSFGTIPFNNTAQGNVTGLRTTAQFSRLNLKLTDSFRGNDVTGYIEGDFSGNNSPTVYQSVNGHTSRLRLYFAELKRRKWEFLAGQTWSWLTPNRTGIGPMPVDLAITYNEDQNLGVGIPYTRAAELRVAYHPDEHWAMGVGIEDPNQFIGNYVALPSGFAAVGSNFDNGNNIGAANLMPDILSKVTYDRDFLGRHFHGEVTGLFTGAHASAMPVGSTSFQSPATFGGGGQIAANYELLPKLVFLVNAFWSDGGAHYLVATGPQLVVRPNAAGTDVGLSMVHAGAGSAGLEWNANEKVAFAVYYGADYYGRNFFVDKYRAARNHYWIWRTRLSRHQQPRHSAGDLRLASDILETKTVWSAAVIRSIFLPDSRSLVCSSRKSQKRAPQHGLLRPSLCFAVDFRHPTPCPLPQLERRNVRSTS